jgi:TonB family protein
VPRDMFGDVIHPAPGLGARPRSAVSVSLVGHAVFAAIIIIVPLMATDDRPGVPSGEVILVTMERPKPLPPMERSAASAATSTSQSPPVGTTLAPRDAPTDIAPERVTTTTIGHPEVGRAGVGEAVIGTPDGTPYVPEVPAVPQIAKPFRPGGLIKTPVKVRHVPPVYPVIAQQARVEGIVIIEAVVGVDGRVTEARVLRSKPLLDEAALAAVRQWEFTPTTLNGVPVPVIMTVTVNFMLH